MQELAGNQGLAVVFALGVLFLEYNPAKVKDVPQPPPGNCRPSARHTPAASAMHGPQTRGLAGLF